jgi:uncharacterized membrane protein YhiD involved in acid resistance
VLAVKFCTAGVGVAPGAAVLVVTVVFEFVLSAVVQAPKESAKPSAQKKSTGEGIRFSNFICPPNEESNAKVRMQNDE